MQCRKCSAKWSLSGHDGPIGNAAPGFFTLMASILAMAGLIVGMLASPLGGIALGVVATFIFVMGLVGCGYQDKDGAYQGSECPECGHKNRIMPLDF